LNWKRRLLTSLGVDAGISVEHLRKLSTTIRHNGHRLGRKKTPFTEGGVSPTWSLLSVYVTLYPVLCRL